MCLNSRVSVCKSKEMKRIDAKVLPLNLEVWNIFEWLKREFSIGWKSGVSRSYKGEKFNQLTPQKEDLEYLRKFPMLFMSIFHVDNLRRKIVSGIGVKLPVYVFSMIRKVLQSILELSRYNCRKIKVQIFFTRFE